MSKHAIVFGATSGIGRALTEILVNDGYSVLVTGRRMDRLETLKNEYPDSIFVRQHDITHLDDTDIFFSEIQEIFNEVDLIIHNSGIGENNFDLEFIDSFCDGNVLVKTQF